MVHWEAIAASAQGGQGVGINLGTGASSGAANWLCLVNLADPKVRPVLT